jgi:hypothetical protein
MISFSTEYFRHYGRNIGLSPLLEDNSHTSDLLRFMHQIAMEEPRGSLAWKEKIIDKNEYDECLSDDVPTQKKGASRLYNAFFDGRIKRLAGE